MNKIVGTAGYLHLKGVEIIVSDDCRSYSNIQLQGNIYGGARRHWTRSQILRMKSMRMRKNIGRRQIRLIITPKNPKRKTTPPITPATTATYLCLNSSAIAIDSLSCSMSVPNPGDSQDRAPPSSALRVIQLTRLTDRWRPTVTDCTSDRFASPDCRECRVEPAFDAGDVTSNGATGHVPERGVGR